VSGSGSGAPNGVVTASSVGATSGGSLIALAPGAATVATNSVDPLIQLQYSVVDEYRNRGSFVMNESTAGSIRRIRDGGAPGTVGAYVWTPSTTFDSVAGIRTPDMLLGSPAYTDVNFGTNGSTVKAVAFGDFSAYYIRDSGSFRFEQSNERFFDTDEIGFRGVLRTDADLIDTGAIKLYSQQV
jgi:HK97 family phage major capsid protein